MPDQPETFELDRAALSALSELLAPLSRIFDEEGLTLAIDRAGWDRQNLGIPDPGVFDAVAQALTSALDDIASILEEDSITLSKIAEALASLIPVVIQVAESVQNVALAAEAPPDTASKLAEDLLNMVLVDQIAINAPTLHAVLQILGAITTDLATPITRSDGLPLRYALPQRKVDFAAIGSMVRDPLAYFRRRFLQDSTGAWLAAEATSDLVGPFLVDVLRDAGLGAVYGQIPVASDVTLTTDEQAIADRLLMVLLPRIGSEDTATGGARFLIGITDEFLATDGIGMVLSMDADVEATWSTGIGDLSVRLAGGVAPLVLTKSGLRLASNTNAPVTFDLTLGYATQVEGGPALRFGSSDGTRFEVGSVSAKVTLLSDQKGLDFRASLDLDGLKLAIQGGDGDGFLSQVLPSDPIILSADIGLDLSVRDGFHVRASGGLEATIGLGLHLGPIEIVDVTIALRALDTSFKLEVYATVGIEIGPVAGVVEGLGIAAALRPAASNAGALGAFDTSLGFRFPNGIGLALDAGSVSGGGYLFCDPDIGQYAGAAELSIAEQFDLTAVGVLNTKLPGGVDGFSLILIATLTIDSGIQLGYGFVLMGIGGLVGINRTMNADAIEACASDGRIDSILFPKDVVKNAPQVIRDIQTVFPPFEGQVVLGLMARIGWETLIHLDLGLMIELPSPIRIVLLGRLSADLPDEEDAVLVLRMNVSGILDFSQNLFAIRASVHDSRLLKFALTGDMALRLHWGDDPFFALSVGGFNARFTPPPKFPSLEPMGISIFDEEDIHLAFGSYFAITTNTLQLGASIDFDAKKDIFMLGRFSASAALGFDAFVQFQPFHFMAGVDGHASICHDDTPFVIAKLELMLEGPGRWHVSGYATFKFLMSEPRIDVNLQFGDDPPPLVPVAADVFGLLVDALGKVGNWSATLPASGDASVALRSTDLSDAVVVHPFGQLTVRQKIVPLEVTIEKYGEATVTGANRFSLSFFFGDETGETTSGSVEDTFARGQYFKSSNDDKLSQPEFERLSTGRGGIGGGGITYASAPRTIDCGYEASVIDDPLGPATTLATSTPVRGAAEVVQSGSKAGKRALVDAGDSTSTARNTVGVRERRFRSLGFDDHGALATASGASTFTEAKAATAEPSSRVAVVTEGAA